MIHGITVRLYQKVQTGTDAFNAPIYDHMASYVDVNDVLVGQPSPEEKTTETALTGRAISYVLGIPKGDANDWEDQIVEFFGHKFQTFGIPEFGIEANIPLRWHKKVKCERYE